MDPSKSITPSSISPKFILAAILIASFLLRFWGVWFGLPYLYHADEPIVVNHALAYGAGDLNPHFFNIPPLVSYLLFFCYGILYIAGRGIGALKSASDFVNVFFLNPSLFYLIARMIFGVLLGTLSVLVLHRLVKRRWSEPAALWASFFLAVNFLHVRDSHYIYSDIPLVTVLLLGFIKIFDVSDRLTQYRSHFLAGAMIGIATAAKYNGAFLGIPYLWICLRCVPGKKWPLCILLAALGAAGAFILLNPYALLDWRFFLKDILEQGASNRGGMPWLHHFRYSLAGAFGLPLLALTLAGWIRGLFSKDIRLQSIALFVLGYYFVLVRWGQPYDRYVLPLIPFLCILAADLLTFLQTRPFARNSSLAGFVGILMVLPCIVKDVQWDRIMSAKDVRTLAKEWIANNVPNGSRIAMDWEFYMPRLSFSRNQILEKMREDDLTNAQRRRLSVMLEHIPESSYELFFMVKDISSPRFLFARPVVSFGVEEIKKRGIGYIFVADGVHPEGDPFIRDLREAADLIARFTPFKDSNQVRLLDPFTMTGGPFLWKDIQARARNGYPIAVYRLKA